MEKKKKSKSISFDEEIAPKDAAQEILTGKGRKIAISTIKNGVNEEREKGTTKPKRKRRRKSKKGGNETGEQKEIASNQKKRKRKKKKKEEEVNSVEEKDEKVEEMTNSEDPVEEIKKKRKEKQFEGERAKEEIEEQKLKIKKKKRKHSTTIEEQQNGEDPGLATNEKKIEKKKVEDENTDDDLEEADTEAQEVEEKKGKSTAESIRARKRRKHQELLQDKKLKAELQMQQKSLNYLSKWKHSINDWKFEKLRQIWLQQNIFDEDKIPQEFWSTVVEYFCGAKGKSRSTILSEAIKIIEQGNEEEEESVKISRARDIVQNLQE